jgi:hypothetical protein
MSKKKQSPKIGNGSKKTSAPLTPTPGYIKAIGEATSSLLKIQTTGRLLAFLCAALVVAFIYESQHAGALLSGILTIGGYLVGQQGGQKQGG